MAKHYQPAWFLGKPDYISNQTNFVSVPPTLTVHVLGEVIKPGIYKLPLGSRIVNGIKAAGGETEKADLDQLNLAAKLVDGARLYVPPKEDMRHETRDSRHNNINIARATNTKIDINRVSVEQLQTLPTIGPAIAKRIVDYRRANGRFETIEQVKKVRGIGEKTFEKIRDRISVESN